MIDSYELIETFFTTLAAGWRQMKLTTGLASKPDCLDSILANFDPFSLSQQQIAIGSN